MAWHVCSQCQHARSVLDGTLAGLGVSRCYIALACESRSHLQVWAPAGADSHGRLVPCWLRLGSKRGRGRPTSSGCLNPVISKSVRQTCVSIQAQVFLGAGSRPRGLWHIGRRSGLISHWSYEWWLIFEALDNSQPAWWLFQNQSSRSIRSEWHVRRSHLTSSTSSPHHQVRYSTRMRWGAHPFRGPPTPAPYLSA